MPKNMAISKMFLKKNKLLFCYCQKVQTPNADEDREVQKKDLKRTFVLFKNLKPGLTSLLDKSM